MRTELSSMRELQDVLTVVIEVVKDVHHGSGVDSVVVDLGDVVSVSRMDVKALERVVLVRRCFLRVAIIVDLDDVCVPVLVRAVAIFDATVEEKLRLVDVLPVVNKMDY